MPRLSVVKRPSREVCPVPSPQTTAPDLQAALDEISQAKAEAEAEVEYHRRAMDSAQDRVDQFQRHFAALGAILEAAPPPSSGQPLFAVYCLGGFTVERCGRAIEEWPSLRGQAIFKYLLAHPRASVSRETLMDLFWPDADPEAARRNLHQAVYSLRQTLRPDTGTAQLILFDNGRYRLNPDLPLWMDAYEFEQHAAAGRRLAQEGHSEEAALQFSFALELYRGDFLEEDEQEPWAVPRREALRKSYREAADWLSQYFLDQGDYDAAIATCDRLLAVDPCHEPAHRRLMQGYHRQGQRTAAIRQYHVCLNSLREELGVSPSPETQALLTTLARDRESTSA
jgi:DNA-binding SARP family transcriptional activator